MKAEAKKDTKNTVKQNRKIIRIFLVTAVVLMVPLVAMQFTDQVKWDLADFAIMGTLLVWAGLVYELAIKKAANAKVRVILAIVLAIVFLAIWAELAVGVFDTAFGSLIRH